MSVLQRRLFNRGGSVARGTGITSGLATPKRGYVDGPGSYQGIGEENLPTGTAGLFELDANAVNTGPETPGNILGDQIFTTQVPTLAELTEKNRPLVESIYGERPDRLTKSEIIAPYILDLSSRLLTAKSKQDGMKGVFDILSQSFAGAAPSLNQALGVRRKEDAAERAEQIEIGKTALSLAESERSKLFDSATSIDLQNLKNNAPKVGDTKFLVKKGDAMLSKNIVAAYETVETIAGKRIKTLRDFNGNLLTDEYVEYKGTEKPKDFSAVNMKFDIVTDDGKTVSTERKVVGKFVQDQQTGDWSPVYTYIDDRGREQEVPGDAVIIGRTGDAANIGEDNAKRDKLEEIQNYEYAGQKFITQSAQIIDMIRANPKAATDFGSLAAFGNRIIADAKAFATLAGYEFEVDDAMVENWLDSAGIVDAALRSAYKDIAISRAVFVEGGSRVTDQDVRNQLDIIGGRLKEPEAAIVLLENFIRETSRDFKSKVDIFGRGNELITGPDGMYGDIGLDYLLQGLDLEFTTPGLTGTEGAETKITTEDNVDDHLDEILKIQEGKTN